jgi:hypothetical protein
MLWKLMHHCNTGHLNQSMACRYVVPASGTEFSGHQRHSGALI